MDFFLEREKLCVMTWNEFCGLKVCRLLFAMQFVKMFLKLKLEKFRYKNLEKF